MFAVTILGNNSAVPAFNRHPTSQVVTMDGVNYLVDCGEGTQIQLLKYKIRRSKISHIFISHLHGDHYFGLIGLISSFGLLARQQELHVYGPAGLQEIIMLQLKVADTRLPFALHLHTISGAATLVETDKIIIKCFPTEHRIECYGFSFEQKIPLRKLQLHKAKAAKIPAIFYERLINGEDYHTKDGKVINNESVTEAGVPGKKFVYCADTKYNEAMVTYLKGATMMYHETTYLDNLRERAEARFHSTTKQAAAIAQKANVDKLLIGHFSSKYDTLEEFEKEAREVFPNTELALEGVCYKV
jgi:ribonuclease Z